MEEDTHENDIKGYALARHLVPYGGATSLIDRNSKNIRTMLVQSLQCVSLLDSNYTASAALGLENWPGRGTGRLFIEAGENGQELEVRLNSAQV